MNDWNRDYAKQCYEFLHDCMYEGFTRDEAFALLLTTLDINHRNPSHSHQRDKRLTQKEIADHLQRLRNRKNERDLESEE